VEDDQLEAALEAFTSRPDIGEALAPHRVALWYDHRGKYIEDMERLWLLLRELSGGLNWDAVERARVPLLSVYFGSIVDHEHTLLEVNEEMVWCAMVGAPDYETRDRVLAVMRASKVERVLRIDPDPPRPHHPSYSLVLYGLLTYETLIRMEPVAQPGLRRYESLIGLEVVHPRDELEVDLLTAFGADWFEGTSLRSEERKTTFLKAEAEVRSRYSAEEFESLKRNVFGLSLEKRAEVAELSRLYDASYRVLSQNVHAMDVAVMDVSRATSSAGEHAEFLRVRASHLLDIAQWCLGTLAIWMNGQFRCGFDEPLEKLQGKS